MATTQQFPPGYVPPYPDTSKGPVLLRTVWVLIALSTIVVALRIFVKTRNARRLYWDDLLIFLALACGIVHAVTITRSIHTGLGRHFLYLNEHQREATLRVGLFSLAWGFASPMFGRIAFCVTLLFLSGTDPRVKKWPIYVFIVLQVAVNMVAIIVFYSQCGSDIEILWDPTKQASEYSQCSNPIIQTNYGYWQGCTSLNYILLSVTDITQPSTRRLTPS